MPAAGRSLKTKLFPLTLSLCLCACGPVGGNLGAGGISAGAGGTVSNPSTEVYKPTALLWEGEHKDGMLWSAYTYQIIGNDVASELLPGSEDMLSFCPNYANLSAPEKVNFWSYLVSALTKYASAFNPGHRVLDVTRGLDPVTGLPTFAEGLLRLSYHDIRDYAFCAFDWQHDKDLAVTYLARSILDPVKNLDCGIKILATQIEKTKKIAIGSYWTILKASGSGSKIKDIQGLTVKLPFCQVSP